MRRTNVSTWRANVPKAVPIFQIFRIRIASGNFYTSLLYKEFYILLDIINVYLSYIRIILYFISLFHVILKKSMWNTFIFCCLVRNENIKRPDFYTLQATRIFSNFPQLKQLNAIKNTYGYCDLLELWSACVGERR